MRVRLSVITPVVFFAACLAASLPFWTSDHLFERADMAANALQIDRASELAELNGPYSRHGFHHPGPAAFYLQAALRSPFAFLPAPMAASLAAQLLINLVLAWWTVRLLRRGGLPPGLADWGLIPLVAPMVFLGGGVPFMPASFWGPLVAVMPVALFSVAAARLLDGDSEGLPAAALGGTLAAQTHVPAAVPVLAGVVVLAVAALRPALRRRWRTSVSVRRHGVAAAGILIPAWAPVLIEQTTREPGNLTLLWRFLRGAEPNVHPWAEVLEHLGQAFTDPLVVLLGRFGDGWGSPTMAAAVLLLHLAVSARQARRAEPGWRLVIAAVWVGWIVAALTARRIQGDLHTYLVYYVYGLAGVLNLVLLRELAERFGRTPGSATARRRAAAAVLVVAVAWLARHPIAAPEPADPIGGMIADLGLDAEPVVHLELGPTKDDNQLWGVLPTIALRLRRGGATVTVEERYVFLLGHEMRPPDNGTPGAVVQLSTRAPGAGETVSVRGWYATRPDSVSGTGL